RRSVEFDPPPRHQRLRGADDRRFSSALALRSEGRTTEDDRPPHHGSVPLVEVDLPFKQDVASSSLAGPTTSYVTRASGLRTRRNAHEHPSTGAGAERQLRTDPHLHGAARDYAGAEGRGRGRGVLRLHDSHATDRDSRAERGAPARVPADAALQPGCLA